MKLAAINNAFAFKPRKNCVARCLRLFVEPMAGAMKAMLYCFLLVVLCFGSASSYANNPPQGRLVASFSYNADGLRIEKQGERGIERYTYDDQSVLSQRDGNNAMVARYTYGPNRLISLKHKTEGTQFYLTDALNSVVNLMTTNGLVQARYQYDAFGNKRSESGSSWNRFAFTGYEEDKETNLLYAKARYYDADTGRFLSQDAWQGDNNMPPSLHKYLYSYQNPTVYVDRSGNFVTLAGGALGAAYGTGQAVGRAIYDASNGDLQNLGHYSSIVAQNAVGGAELGLSIDSLALSGGMALPVSSALGMAGGGALTLDGTPKDLNTFAKDQGRDGAIGFVAGPILAKAAPIVAKIPGVGKTVNYVGNKIGGAVEKVSSKYEVGALDKALGVKPPPSPPVASTINVESSDAIAGSQVPNSTGFEKSPAFFTSEATWTAPSKGTGQQYKIFQQEIDWSLEVKGVTNIERAQGGGAPYIMKDGAPQQLQLHHSRQNGQGPLFELSRSTHLESKATQGGKALHPYGAQQHPEYPVNRPLFKKDVKQYWMDRAAGESQ